MPTRCCIPNCRTEGLTVHRFANPNRYLDLMKTWLDILGMDSLREFEPEDLYYYKRICTIHFELKYKSEGNPRLHKNAIPALYLPSREYNMSESTNRPLVLCGPSGSGKSSLLQKLLKHYPNNFGFSVSHTTRKPRDGEVHGVHYHFVDEDAMKNGIESGEFIESAVYSGNIYGTSKSSVRALMNCGKVCVLDIDIQGAKQVKETDMDPLMIFIKPPSLDELEKRLRARNTETDESLARRLTCAKQEMEYGLAPNNFHHIIVNDDLERAYEEFERLLFNHFKFSGEIAQSNS